MKLSEPVANIQGIGDVVAAKLRKLHIETVGDLLWHLPYRYEDYSRLTDIASAQPGLLTVKGQITRVHTRRTQTGRSLTEALIEDDTGSMQAVWFNQPYLKQTLPKRQPVYVAGELAFAYQRYALQSPTVERVSAFPKDAARVVPIYPETEGISSKQLRGWIRSVLPKTLEDPLPPLIRKRYALSDKAAAMRQVHFPKNLEAAERARFRLGFEELYVFLLAIASERDELEHEKSLPVRFEQDAITSLLAKLPFDLTDSQRKCAWRIMLDMQQTRPMHRLLQGDVGSGKTLVAALAAALAAKSGIQTVLLAPTEVLANQHARTLSEVLDPLAITVRTLTGSTKPKEKSDIKSSLQEGGTEVLVATHAVLEPDVQFARLGFVVVDEQHRFGVKQRALLRQKSLQAPHFLSMTATPIPRSLALTVYGDLDISILRELPPGRKPVITKVATNARKLYEHLGTIMEEGGQVFVVCPLIAESDTLGVTSVEKELYSLKQQFPGRKIESVHGRLKSADKEAVLQRFRDGTLDILVSTTVVEVGLDVANATVMLIEGAERFGLATLHQLRGRVGRRNQQAYCYLRPSTPLHSAKRLQLLEKYHDGRVLAEKDLQQRGSGEIYGERQHGMHDLRVARLDDVELLQQVRSAVKDTTPAMQNARLQRAVKARRHLRYRD